MWKKVAITMPAHNEEQRIGITLKKYFDYFLELKSQGILDFEIIVVLNACVDNTKKVVEKFYYDELKVLEFKRGGKGFAVIEGFKNALQRDNDLIGFVDADNATPPNAFYGLVQNINNYDGIIANRWDKRSKIYPPRPWFFSLRSIIFNFLVRSLFFFTYRDTQCGAKLFTRNFVQSVVPKLGSSEWSFDVDILYYAHRDNAKIKSIPTEWHNKEGSKISFSKTPGRMFFSVIRLRLVHSPFHFISRFHGKLPEKLKVHYWFG
jgi:dolichyl-phosphate beta-glucosyltransferase